MKYNDHEFDPVTDEERAAREREEELARRIRREVLRVQSGEADEEIRADREREQAEEEARQEEQRKEERRRSNIFWLLFSGNILVRKGASEYYRYMICIAAMFFVSIFVMFTALHLDMKYTRLEREVQILRERSIRLQEQRYSRTTHSAIVERLRERGIDPAVAGALCREVHYAVGERRFFAIGFRNDAGGWELRSPQFKGSSAPKTITTFDRHGDTALLFEGFFDLLSYLTLQHEPTPTADTAVLNSVVNLPRALPFLARHATIHTFLDNDEAGRLTLERLRSALPGATVIDRAESYRTHKDLNESLRPSAKISRTPRRRGRKL